MDQSQSPVGVLLMTFGTAETLADVPAYLSSVRGGRPVPEDLVVEMQRRFSLVGGSPLPRITREQAAALEECLNRPDRSARDSRQPRFRVAVGMRHAPPFIKDGLADLIGAGAQRVIGLILSPQYSTVIMGGYLRALESARAEHPDVQVSVVHSWHDEPAFLDALAQRVQEALGRMDPVDRSQVQLFFTAHSLPRSVADGEPAYIQQLQDTAEWIAERTGLSRERWQFAYQSAGHTPDPWLTPDIKDLFPALAEAGHRRALVVPVQFLADHLEVLYDIDIAASQQAAEAGIELDRTESLNTMPLFIEAMAGVVERAVAEGMAKSATTFS